MKSILHFFIVFYALLQSNIGFSDDLTLNKLAISDTDSFNPKNYRMVSQENEIQYRYHYHYLDRYHSVGENFKYLGVIYGLSWGLYFAIQPDAYQEGSWKKYKENFGKIVFDQDEPYWNWIIHPLAGSQLYLFYRANGYSRMDALGMTFISSFLFEFTIEIYTEPASIQDLYQTPVFGSLLGLGFETISLYLLNIGHPAASFFGHIFNLYTLFWFYEGKIKVIPMYDGKKSAAITFEETF